MGLKHALVAIGFFFALGIGLEAGYRIGHNGLAAQIAMVNKVADQREQSMFDKGFEKGRGF